MVHKLVADLFVENPHKYTQVDHIDGNSANNNASNLRFVKNLSENIRNPATFAKKLNPKPLLQIDKKSDDVVCEWENAYTVAKQLSLSSSNILACCKRRTKTAYGFKWKFI